MAQDRALGLGEQLVAPVKRRPQGLVAWQRQPPPTGQHPEAIFEPGYKPLDAERRDTSRGQLKRQGDAIELPADAGDPPKVPLRCELRRRRRPRALRKKVNGAV